MLILHFISGSTSTAAQSDWPVWSSSTATATQSDTTAAAIPSSTATTTVWATATILWCWTDQTTTP